MASSVICRNAVRIVQSRASSLSVVSNSVRCCPALRRGLVFYPNNQPKRTPFVTFQHGLRWDKKDSKIKLVSRSDIREFQILVQGSKLVEAHKIYPGPPRSPCRGAQVATTFSKIRVWYFGKTLCRDWDGKVGAWAMSPMMTQVNGLFWKSMGLSHFIHRASGDTFLTFFSLFFGHETFYFSFWSKNLFFPSKLTSLTFLTFFFHGWAFFN